MSFKIKDGIRIGTVDVFNNQGQLLVNAPSASKWLNSRTITLAGDLSGSVAIDGSQNVTLTASIVGGSYNLSTEAGADAYSEKIRLNGPSSSTDDIILAVGPTGTTNTYGLTIEESGDTITFKHADTSTQASVNNSGNTFIQDVTLDEFGHITGLVSGTVSVGDGLLTVSVAEDGTTGSSVYITTGTGFSANDSANSTYDIHVGPSLKNLADTMTGATPAGFLKKTGQDTYTIDTNTYLTSQSNDFGTFAISGTDSGYTWGAANTNTNQVADTLSDTLTFVKGGGINLYTSTVAGTDAIKIEHADTSSVANLSSDNSGLTFIQDLSLTFDTYGHVTGATSGTGTVPIATTTVYGVSKLGSDTEQTVAANTVTATAGRTYAVQHNANDQLVVNVPWTDVSDTTYSISTEAGADSYSEKIRLTGSDSVSDDIILAVGPTGTTNTYGLTIEESGDTITFKHADTSSQSSVNNSNGNVIQDITIDEFGHISSLGSVNLDDRYYTESEADTRFVNVDGDSMTGFLTLHANPTQAMHAATKEYVDSVAEGLQVHESVVAATTGTLASLSGGTVTYANGASGLGATLTLTNALTAIDGRNLVDGDRVLVKNEANEAHNGIYVRTSSTVFTRSADYNTPAEIQSGDFVFVTYGTSYAGSGWVQTNAVDTIGTDAIGWDQFSGAGTYLAGTGLQLDGSTFSIDSTVVTLTGEQTLTNKTIINPTISGLYLSNGSIVFEGTSEDDFETTLAVTNPTADRSVIIQDASGTLALTSDINSGSLTVTVAEDGTTGDSVYITTGSGHNANATANSTYDIHVGPALKNLADTMTGIGSGFLRKNGADTYTVDTTTYTPTTRTLTVTTNNGLTGGGAAVDLSANRSWTLGLTGQALALHNLSSNGIFVRTASNTVAARSIAAGTDISVTNGDGVSGNPTIENTSTLSSVTGRGATTATSIVLQTGASLGLGSSTTAEVVRSAVSKSLSTVIATEVDTWAASTYRSAKYIVQITQGTNYQVSEIMVMHNGTTTTMTEFAVLETNGELATFTSDVSAGNVRLIVTMGSATAATIKVDKTVIAV